MGSLRIRAGDSEIVADGDRPLTIGRGRDTSIYCFDPRVSRHHLTIRQDENGWLVEDAGSSNGTYRDGARVSRLRVVECARLLLGHPVDGEAIDFEPAKGRDPAPTLSTDLGRLATTHHLAPVLSIGRAPDNDIVLSDLLVSRHHAILSRDPQGRFGLADLGSHNGTFVNGQRVSSTVLHEGDIVGIGAGLLRLTRDGLEEYTETGEVAFEAIGLTVRTPDGTVLLDDVSFTLERCSLLAVVGSSGAGKSTLLNALAGFRPAQEGSVLFGGRDLYRSFNEMRQRIGYVPQEDILHRQLTVRRALRYSGELRFPPDVTASEREQRMDEVMAELGLAERADLSIGRLSGGQRKRTSIALELLTRPGLLFLDEPTSGLDPGYEKTLMSLFRSLADAGRTVVVVTHSLQSLSLADRVLFLAPGGRTAFFGPPDEALAYFGYDEFADVFSELEGQREHDWKERFRRDPRHERYVRTPLDRRRAMQIVGRPPPPREAPPHHRWHRQLWTLVRRYLAVIASDPVNLAILLLQAPLLALIILMALPDGGFDLHYAGAIELAPTAIIFLVVSCTYLGASNAVREIVKEWPIYERERAVGLSISAYLASKVAVLAVVTIGQAVVVALLAAARQGGPVSASALGAPRLELIVGLALTGLAAMGMGLLVSACVSNADKALALLPLILVPQLVLTSPLLAIESKPLIGQLSYVASAQWGFAAVASTVDTNRLADNGGPAAAHAQRRARWTHSPSTWYRDTGWLLGILLFELAATGLVLRRRDPNLLRAAGAQQLRAPPQGVTVARTVGPLKP
jgi:ABC-type multidrug transport system ATPase subunit